MNVVEDQDEIYERSQPTDLREGQEYAEDEDYDRVKSACFIYSGGHQLLESCANALDCKVYCANNFNCKCWPQSTCDALVEVNDLEPTFNYRGLKIRFLQLVSCRTGQPVFIHQLDPKGKDVENLVQDASFVAVHRFIEVDDIPWS